VNHARNYVAIHGALMMSIISRFEILRGLKSKNASTKLAVFEKLSETAIILPLQENTIQIASDIYADLRKRGLIIEDADILIAATALEHNLVLVTNNEKHFARIPGLKLADWTKP
jgi:tRNA(fMet)-specific endonuclease VapC